MTSILIGCTASSWEPRLAQVQNFTGNKTLTKADLAPVLEMFAKELMSKNVAQARAHCSAPR